MNPHAGELDMADGLILFGAMLLLAALLGLWEVVTRKRS